MNKPGNEPFKDDLKALEAEYRSQASEEPPALLDQAVLNAARRAVEPHAIRPWSFSWMHTAATAAVIIVGLTLVLNQSETLPGPATAPEPEFESIVPLMPEDRISRPDEAFEQAVTVNDALPLPDASALNRLEIEPEIQAPEESTRTFQERVQEQQASEADSRESLFQPGHSADSSTPGRGEAGPDRDNALRALPAAASTASAVVERDIATESSPTEQSKAELPERRMTRSMAADSPETVDRSDPEAWIAAILRLREDENPQWQPELEQFLVAYPEFPLPAPLKDAMKEDAQQP